MKKVLGFVIAAAFCCGVAGEGTETLENGVLTLDGAIKNIATEADYGSGVTNVVLQNGGGVAFSQSLGVTVPYRIAGDGLNSTGIVSTANGVTVGVPASFAKGAVGHVLLKRGPGTLYAASVGAAAAAPTRFIVEEGKFQCASGDFWGGHTTANNNCTIDVREGAIYDHGTGHGVVGPLELTGATFTSRNASPWGQWADASLNGGVTSHASATPSYMSFASWGFLGHNNHTNCVFDVEDGARLIVDGVLSNGFSNVCKNRLTKRGAGELVLLKNGGWSGGTFLEDGTVTIASSKALPSGAIVIVGNVTLKVLSGVSVDLTGITTDGSAHTLTITGDGQAILPATLPENLTVDASASGSHPSAVEGSTVYLNGGEVTVDVAAGETFTISEMVESEVGLGQYTDIVKTGDGTLVLPTGSQQKFAKLIVRGGFANVADETCFGLDGVSLQNNGGLRFLASLNQGRSRITCKGACTIDVPEGVTLGVHSNFFVSTGATVTKTGLGVWQLNSNFRRDALPWIDFTGTTWVVHEGCLRLCAGDNFGGASVDYPLVIEVHENGVIETKDGQQHTPLSRIRLRGGTMNAFRAQFREAGKLESGADWKGFGLQGPITVLPSEKPSRIIARQCHLAHGINGRTVFDVQSGAVLEVDTMLQPGRSGGKLVYNGLVKRGGGTLRLLKPIGTQGTFAIEDGTVELGPKMKLNASLALNVAPTAKLVLDDGAQIATTATLASKLCSSADVWFDASQLNLSDGATVGSVPNRGTAGGTFANVKAFDSYTPVAPSFVANGINGLGSVAFNGSQALVTRAYTNRGERVTVFLVSKWTSWANEGGKGKWGGPFSLNAFSPLKYTGSGDDNQCSGSLSYQHGGTTMNGTVSTYCYDASVTLNGAMGVDVAYLTHASRDAGLQKVFTELWWKDGAKAGTNTLAATAMCDIDAVCVGGRLRLGVPQIWGAGNGSNRMYIGQIGEVLVFSRALTDEETATISDYLKSKWFSVGELSSGEQKALAPTLNVEVSEGEAEVASDFSSSAQIVKTGTGTLRFGGTVEGTAFVGVEEGGLALRKGTLKPQVDIWVDASESSGMSFDAGGRVTNLVNRGSCGGSFIRNMRGSNVPYGPEWSESQTINGRPTLVFDGNSALALFSYTNMTSPRSLSVYCIGERTSWQLNTQEGSNGGGFGRWAGPFSFGSLDAKASDENVEGVVSVQEESGNRAWIDMGNASAGSQACPTNGEPYLLVFHSTIHGCLYAYEKAVTPTNSVTRLCSNAQNNEPFHVGVVQLATRTVNCGQAQWYGVGNTANRCWYGKMGEFIATTEPLSEDQEYELFAYLRKKWFNKGTGTATPPPWLGGVAATPNFSSQTHLEMADGTSLEQAADPLALGYLSTEGTVDWTRVWDGLAVDSFPFFNVAGDVALGSVVLSVDPVPSQAMVLGFAGSALTTPSWTVTGGLGAGNAKVGTRAEGYWLNRAGTVLFVR